MKNIKNSILAIIVISALTLSSCYEEKMDWKNDPYGDPISESEIPLTADELLAALGPLKEYMQFQMGIGVDMELYMKGGNLADRVNENFNVVTVGYHMKHGPMVGNDGQLRYAAVDQFIERLPQNIGLFGHALGWHQNQNGEYLRSLIVPDQFTPQDLSADNLLDLSGLKDDSFTDWQRLNPGAGITIVNDEGILGGKALRMISNTSSSQAYNLQLRSPVVVVGNGEEYTVSFFIRSDKTGKGRISFEKGSSNLYPYLDYGTGTAGESFSTGTNWKQIRFNITVNSDELQLNFDLGYLPEVTYYIDVDHLDIVPASVNTDPTAVEKTDAEKKQIIGDAFAYWIENMVGHYKNRVHAWDVVNEPVNDAGTGLRHGNGKGDDGDIFHWQDFLGEDYLVTAFRLAREAGNSDDILFINDYNLESNLNKCRKLIEFVQYIESKGQRVDGIGTQMHIAYNSDLENIAESFRLLAATGKQIKISELDIKVNTVSPDPARLQEQADMYYQVAKLYREIIPAAQQYGITVWCVSDNADEHANWLKDDAPCLWDAKYNRKMAYKNFLEGMTGKPADQLISHSK
ncbi:MAG: endo-1,4-beta-xylanase [Dysgonamonadaceae bacterium]|jgi:GH35 family endo-1,4-beta-xylanase|nr:endo-1,4-beta-xylanase [Dysgonamonadaceae bacterium]